MSNPCSRQAGRHGPPAGERLEAAPVAAPADDVVVVGHVDVADVAGRAVGAAVHVTAGDDARADAGAHLHEEQELHVPPRRPVLAHRHDVHVVVDQRGRAEAHGQPLADGIAVPSGHDRRADGTAGGELDRAGQPHPDPAHAGEVAAGLGHEVDEGVLEPVEDGVGPVGDGDVPPGLAEHLAGEVGHRDARVGGAEIAAQHHAGVAVERQAGRRPPTGGAAVAARDQQLAGQQGVDPLRHGRPGLAGERGELGSRVGLTAAHEVEDGARAPARDRSGRWGGGHGG